MPVHPNSKANLKRGKQYAPGTEPGDETADDVIDVDPDEVDDFDPDAQSPTLLAHLRWEERHVFPYLPRKERTLLLKDHRRIRRDLVRGRVDVELITSHMEAETVIFADFVPIDQRVRVETDHGLIGSVLSFTFLPA